MFVLIRLQAYISWQILISTGNGTANWILHGICKYQERCERRDFQSLERIPWNKYMYLDGGYSNLFQHGDMYV